MARPALSKHFEDRRPSVIRLAGLRFAERGDEVEAINVALGNVSLPMHPAMRERMLTLGSTTSPFADGAVRYTATAGTEETRAAFLNILSSSGLETEQLHVQVTEGGSQAMELVIVGLGGAAGAGDRPLLLIDAAYTNYTAYASRLGRSTVSVTRTLQPDGEFTLPSIAEIEAVAKSSGAAAMLVIPYDNPTGQFYRQEQLDQLAELCVRNDMWLVSDEAYRELFYTDGHASSVWAIDEDRVSGIAGRRISIESASKVWNACGLRIGALVTDNSAFHTQAVAEATASLCPNAIGQYIFGGLANESGEALRAWYQSQRDYYSALLEQFTSSTKERIPNAIVSRPDASLYSVVDLRGVADGDFDAMEFVLWCATEGRIDIDEEAYTLLTAPMAGFYSVPAGSPNPGRSQMRIAYVEPPQRMALVPLLLAGLLEQYKARRHSRTA